jgi:putative transposase
VRLRRACYQEVEGQLNAQMTCTAIRLVTAAYQCACSNHRPPQRPFQFRRRRALFLIGPRGRDARLCPDGTLSLWTVAGHKQLSCRVPEAFQPRLAQAKTIESLTVLEHAGKLVGRLTITLEVPDPLTARPATKPVVGNDLNETNALVAMDGQERVLFVSGKAVKVRNRRTAKTRARLQRKLAAHKAQHRIGIGAAPGRLPRSWRSAWWSEHRHRRCWSSNGCRCHRRRKSRCVGGPCDAGSRCGNAA